MLILTAFYSSIYLYKALSRLVLRSFHITFKGGTRELHEKERVKISTAHNHIGFMLVLVLKTEASKTGLGLQQLGIVQ